MPSISKSALVNHSAADMFHLVDNVDEYPEFLPWCGGARVLSRTEDEVRASIDIAHGSVRRSFSTCNRLQKNKMVEMRLIEGPFKHLEGYWRFDILSESASKVSLDLEYEFSNLLVSLALGPVFSHIANTLVDAFIKRADTVYGKT